MNTPPRKSFFLACLCFCFALATAALVGCHTTEKVDLTDAKHVDDGMIRGFAVPAWRKGDFRTQEYQRAIADIVALNSNWVSIHSTFQQDGMRGTKIYDDNLKGGVSPDIEEQRKAVQVAHDAGLKVLLKPHVNIRSGEGWRGDIGTGMTPEELAAWFEAYDSLIVAHARMAEQEKVEMFAVGTELMSMEIHAAEWRNTIAKIRAVYHGPLVYCANHSSENAITWWDALDYIGIDAYYPVSDSNHPTVESMKNAWKPYAESIAALSTKFGKKVIFTEVGYMSTDGTSERPYDWKVSSVYDGQEQSDCFMALFESVYSQPWFAGLFIWNWDIYDSRDGTNRNGYSPKGKPAEAVVSEWFSRTGK